MEEKLCEIRIKESVDYTGKLNNHEDYLKMLKVLEKKCEFIGITDDHEIVDEFRKDIIGSEKSYDIWGIWTSYERIIYYIEASESLFEYLKKYETFSKYITGKIRIIFNREETGDYVDLTNFGTSDIAFYDKEQNVLLRTNTHEGFVYARKDIDQDFNNRCNRNYKTKL